jgi:hypothetical protein
MTATQILTELHRRDVEVVAVGDRIRWRPKDAVTPDLLDALAEQKAELLRLLPLVADYRTLLRRAFALNGGPTAPASQCGVVVNEEVRLSTNLGPALAKAIFRAERAAWEASTGRCAVCGEDPHPLRERQSESLQ